MYINKHIYIYTHMVPLLQYPPSSSFNMKSCCFSCSLTSHSYTHISDIYIYMWYTYTLYLHIYIVIHIYIYTYIYIETDIEISWPFPIRSERLDSGHHLAGPRMAGIQWSGWGCGRDGAGDLVPVRITMGSPWGRSRSVGLYMAELTLVYGCLW